MRRLVVTDSHGNTTEHSLDRPRVTLGRAAGNDIVLDDRAVSGRHAAIVNSGSLVVLEDLHSTNGTQVNGRPVTRHPLGHGDVITMGHQSARYFSDEGGADDPDQTVVLRSAALPPTRAPSPVPPPPEPPVTRPAPARLRVTSGSIRGRELTLSKPLTTIGKPGVQVAAITRRADGYYLVQLEGTGGRRLRLNDTDIGPDPRRLADRDVIELAGTRMEFRLNG